MTFGHVLNSPLPQFYFNVLNTGDILATEVMIANAAVRNIIRESKTQSLNNVILTSQSQSMKSMDASLRDLYQQGIITYDTAVTRAKMPAEMRSFNDRGAAVSTDGTGKL